MTLPSQSLEPICCPECGEAYSSVTTSDTRSYGLLGEGHNQTQVLTDEFDFIETHYYVLCCGNCGTEDESDNSRQLTESEYNNWVKSIVKRFED